jgi:hypothetical protein
MGKRAKEINKELILNSRCGFKLADFIHTLFPSYSRHPSRSRVVWRSWKTLAKEISWMLSRRRLEPVEFHHGSHGC